MRNRMAGLMLVLMLAGCDDPAPPPPPPPVIAPAAPVYAPLTVTPEVWKHVRPGCKGQDCPWIEVELQRVADKGIDALAEAELANLVPLDDKPAHFDTIETLSAAFWPKTGKQWNISLQSKVLHQAGPILTLQLDNDTYTGGAHGISATRFLNLDRGQANKRLVLADVLVPGKETAFKALAQSLHAAWLKEMEVTDAEFAQTWPFHETDNFALTDKGILLKYQNYELGPYAFGQPEFLLPKDKLAELVKPEFLR